MDNRATKGIALYTRKLIEGLIENANFDLHMVHFDKVTDPLYGEVNEIVMPKVNLPYGSRFISLLLFFWKYRNDPFDIIHWFHPRIYPFYWLAPAKIIVVTVHGAGDITAPNHFVFSRTVFNFVLKNFHKWIDAIIVDSKDAKSEVVKHYGFPDSKVKIVYLGGGEKFIPTKKDEARALVVEKYGIESPYILDVARLIPHKNVLSLIKAYSLMRKEYPEHKEKLVIVGGSSYNTTYEYDEAEKSYLKKDIKFIGFVEAVDLNSVYSASDLFVFPSLDEGFGLPVLEAMASGVPVITSNIASMPEIGGDAVIMVSPLDIDKIALAMHNVLTDKNLREKMIEKGLARAKEFTWTKTVEETESLYLKTLVK